ncbi:iron-sulfur cluster assembly scaffold protein [Desulfovibrio sulfodismutans]|uniref:Iron-sulfur cluster assembly scaffold protein n=1 Tax=Desulfolutivibrio sulfodismutans TaxID=63561 RepID=A0A7K3NQ30_9BACT|nr:iron-sulfur cluster assembly scaffold protein [Desulfolutivibrio sulfodismutans]NDY57309.1 iron-sulfur cluster assembly scaffold protein [Desulfolutivibrio sulfodismutans]QLA13948.1 iron-sulfur cluster assembly scaffold protein [Desulfolutivibrio sulfodismutans DSM 3696]
MADEHDEEPARPAASLDDWASELQAGIDDQALSHYGPEAFRRWKTLPAMGRVPKADGVGRLTGACGDTIEISLTIDADRIVTGAFFSDGCGASQVCASVAVELAIGTSVDAAYDITDAQILAVLPGFPADETHCAFLAAEALRQALQDASQRSRA